MTDFLEGVSNFFARHRAHCLLHKAYQSDCASCVAANENSYVDSGTFGITDTSGGNFPVADTWSANASSGDTSSANAWSGDTSSVDTSVADTPSCDTSDFGGFGGGDSGGGGASGDF
jgi:uncharacterized membrane protein YgcG